jgi:VanZ family protein
MATRYRGLVIAVNLTYAVILLLFGLVSEVPEAAEKIPDRAAHAVASAVHAALIFVFLRELTSVGPAAIVAASAATLYGGLIEMLQLTQPSRNFEPADLAANALGACLMACVIFSATHLHAKGRER